MCLFCFYGGPCCLIQINDDDDDDDDDEGNRSSGVALAPWFIHLRAQRPTTGRWAPTPMSLRDVAPFTLPLFTPVHHYMLYSTKCF